MIPNIPLSKNTTTMALPFAKPDGMALWYNSRHPREPLRDELVEVAVEWFY